MLDNVIDINYYAVDTAKTQYAPPPSGLGIMGFQDALYQMRLPYSSDAAVEFADRSMEAVSYHAIAASSDLAAERGSYSTFKGSLWDQGILPIDSIALLAKTVAKNTSTKTKAKPWIGPACAPKLKLKVCATPT